MKKLKAPSDPARLASAYAVARALGVSRMSLTYWVKCGAPCPQMVRSANGTETMLWSVEDISRLKEWARANKKIFRSSTRLEEVIRYHARQIEEEMAAQRKPDDALVLLVKKIDQKLRLRGQKVSPEMLSNLVAAALCEEVCGFDGSPELVAPLAEAILPSVVTGMNLLN